VKAFRLKAEATHLRTSLYGGHAGFGFAAEPLVRQSGSFRLQAEDPMIAKPVSPALFRV
jgi:hypothetical protein